MGEACLSSQKAPKLSFPKLNMHDRNRSAWFPIDLANPAHSSLDDDQFCSEAEKDLPPYATGNKRILNVVASLSLTRYPCASRELYATEELSVNK